ncbi:MAG: hypothetical protein J2P18_22755, partial [Nocardia sp.]|nr:hypothetical protein [Nocardia sp.]
MRRGTGLRRRPAAGRGDNATPAQYSDSEVDPPIVATLVKPLQELRAALGTGVATPNPAIATALSSAASQAADTEGPHRQGVHALESTWTGPGSDATVPAIRKTQTQIGDISDRGPAYLSVLQDAHGTSARAAGRVDQIIADFRSDARTILGNAKSAPDTDKLINRATHALRSAITTVTAARTEMDDHSRRLDQMGPLTVTTPAGLQTSSTGTTPAARQTGETFDGPLSNSEGDSSSSSLGGNSSQGESETPSSPSSSFNSQSPSSTSPSGYSGLTGQSPLGGQSGGMTPQVQLPPGQPVDPAQLAQLQLQQLLVQAGVQLGTTAINAGVSIGTDLIDKIAEVGSHAIDTVASTGEKIADKAIPKLLDPDAKDGKTDPSGDSGDSTDPSSSGKSSDKMFDFGGGMDKSDSDTGGSIIPDPSDSGASGSDKATGDHSSSGDHASSGDHTSSGDTADNPAPQRAPAPAPAPAAPPAAQAPLADLPPAADNP